MADDISRLYADSLRRRHELTADLNTNNIAADGSMVTPDAAASAVKAAPTFGVDPLALVDHGPSLDDWWRDDAVRSALTSGVGTNEFVSKPINGMLASDEISDLSTFEKLWGGVTGMLWDAPPLVRDFARGATSRLAGAVVGDHQKLLQLQGDIEKSRDDIFAEEVANYEKLYPGEVNKPMVQQLAETSTMHRMKAVEGLTEERRAGLQDESIELLKQRARLLKIEKSLPQGSAPLRFSQGPLARAAKVEGTFNQAMATLDAFAQHPVDGAAFMLSVLAEQGAVLAAQFLMARMGLRVGVPILQAYSSLNAERSGEVTSFLMEKGYDLSTEEGIAKILENTDLLAEAAKRGTERGVVIAIMDAMSMMAAGKALTKGKFTNIAAQTAVQGGMAGAGEAAAGIKVDGKISGQDVVIEMLADAFGAPVDVVAATGGTVLQRRAEDRFIRNLDTAASDAANSSEVITLLGGIAERMQLRARSPAAFREYLQSVGVGDTTLFMDAEALGAAVDEGKISIEQLGITEELLTTSRDTGAKVPINAVNFAEHVAGTDMVEMFVQNATTVEGGLTLAEATEARAEIAKVQAELEAQIKQEPGEGEMTPRRQLYEQIYAQLLRTGPKNSAKASALLFTSFYETMAQRTGNVDIYDRFGIDVRGPADAIIAPEQLPPPSPLQNTDPDAVVELEAMLDEADAGNLPTLPEEGPVRDALNALSATEVDPATGQLTPEALSAVRDAISSYRTYNQKAADINAARELVAQGDEALGLPQGLASQVNPIYRRGVIPVKPVPGKNMGAAKFIESLHVGEPVTDFTAPLTPTQMERVSSLMAAEVELALQSSNSAATWYSTALDKAVDVAGIKWPMLLSDEAAMAAGLGTKENARFIFTYILAVTSQNVAVMENVKATERAFDALLKRWASGDYTMGEDWGTGDKQKAMNENFAKFNGMFPMMPGDTPVEKLQAMDDLFRKAQTVSQWVREMKKRNIPYSPPGSTNMNAVVYGSSTLGPKIGNGFWQNLNGNFSPLTVDLWMRRTWGRLTGKSIGLDEALPGQTRRLKAAIKRSRSRINNIDDFIAGMETELANIEERIKTLDPKSFEKKKFYDAEIRQLKRRAAELNEAIPDAKGMQAPEPYKPEYNNDPDELLAYAKRLKGAWEKEYKRLVAEHGKGAVPKDLQPTWAKAAKTIISNLSTPLDQVSNGTQRVQIETAGMLALEKLASRGIYVTMADMQALLWYPEKELWTSMRVKLDVDPDGYEIPAASDLNESYDTAFAKILKEQGYEVSTTVAGAEGAGAGGDGGGAVAGQADVDGAPEQGADVGADALSARYGLGRATPLAGAPNVRGATGPDLNLIAVADSYAASIGIDLRRQASYADVDPAFAARVAQAYEEMEHAPNDPVVAEAFNNLIEQTTAQYNALISAGYEFTFYDSETDPYEGKPWNAMRDLRANKKMAVYATYAGYGTEGITDTARADNPMLRDTGLTWKDQNGVEHPVTANDLFRAVHDAFGHGIEGAGFRAEGEENAWQAHIRLFTGSAVAAITSETRGQNSWLNYGPYGETNRTALIGDTVFAEQKTGLMPSWTWEEKRVGDAQTAEDKPDGPDRTLYQRGIAPDAAGVRGEGAADEGTQAEAGGATGLADQQDRPTSQRPVTAEDLDRVDDPEFLQEFLQRPGWGVVTATTMLPDTEFYRTQRAESPELYQMSLDRQEAKNQTEQARLLSTINRLGLPYIEVQGMYAGEPDGTSYMVIADEATVMGLGRSFLQESVLTRNGLVFTMKEQPDVPPSGGVVTGDAALAQEFYSILPSGVPMSMLLDFKNGGPGVPVIPQDYTQLADRPQLPVRPDGLVELHHWSSKELTNVDPAYAGTGPLKGEERARGAKLTFFGINPRPTLRSAGTGYVKEAGLGPVEHVGFVDPARIYPWHEDPDNLIAGVDKLADEAAVQAAGYIGYYTTDDGSDRAPLGNVAALFEAIPVQVLQPEVRTLNQSANQPPAKKVVRYDNPGGGWLAEKVRHAEEDMAEPEASPMARKGLRGSTTAYIMEGVPIPTSLLKNLQGANNEKPAAGKLKYDALMKSVEERGFDQGDGAILVGINHLGQAYIMEGNNRVAVANDLGIDTVVARIQWYNGGETADGPLTPEIVNGLANDARTLNQSSRTDTAAFKKWFKKSKIVDADGKPLVVYHATKQDFESFKARFGDGLIFLTKDPEFASKWMIGTGGIRETPDDVKAVAAEARAYERELGDARITDEIADAVGTDEGNAVYDEIRAGIKADVVARYGQSALDIENTAGIRIMPVYLSVQKPFNPEVDYALIEDTLRGMPEMDGIIEKGRHKTGSWVVYENETVISKLKELGFDGVYLRESSSDPEQSTIAVFDPTQIKSVYNEGTFSPEDARILNQGEGDNRAVIRIPTVGVERAETVIELFTKADESSFMHEASHYFLEVFRVLANDANAPQQIIDDMAQINAWLGRSPDDTSVFTTEQQEQWADAFEIYLMEGRAPSKELRGAFAQFSRWLTNIYTTFLNIGVPATPEITAIMDRMLATDQQIAEAQETEGGKQLFDRQGDMSPKDWDAYKKIAVDAEDDAYRRLLKTTMTALRRKRTKWWKQEYASERKKVAARLRDTPTYQLLWALTSGENDTDLRMDKAELFDTFGKWANGERMLAALSRNRLGGKRAIYKPGGLPLAAVAQLFGFRDAAEMVTTLARSQRFEEAVVIETDRIMEQRHGDPMNEATLYDEAVAAMKNPSAVERTAREASELQARSKSTGAGGTRPPTQWQLLNAQAKASARETVEKLTVRQTLSYGTFQRAAQKAARRAQSEFAKVVRDTSGRYTGDAQRALLAAAEAKRQQLYNEHLYREARDAAKAIERGIKRIKTYSKGSVRSKIGTPYIETIDALLSQYRFRKETNKDINSQAVLRQYIDAMVAEGREAELAISEDAKERAAAKHYTELTTEEMRQVIEAVTNIEHMGRNINKALDEKEKRDRQVILSEIVATADQHLKDTTRARGRAERSTTGATLRQTVLSILTADTLLRELDGQKTLGPAWRAIKQPIDEGMSRLQERREAASAHIADELYKKHYTAKQMRQMRNDKRYYEELGETLTKWDLISMALNSGNKANWERMTNPNGQNTFDAQAVKDVLARELTENDMRFVQGTLDYIGSFWPEIADLETKVTGVRPKRVEAEPQIGEEYSWFTGGYFPIKYDAELVTTAQAKEQAEDLGRNGSAGKAQTANGHTKARTQSTGRPIVLDMGVVEQHVFEVLHDLEMRIPINDSWKLITSSNFVELMVRKGKNEDLRALESWLKDIAAGETVAAYGFEKHLRWLRKGFVITKLGLNIGTILLQPLGLAQSMVVVGKAAMGRGMASYLSSPSEWATFVSERSAVMRERVRTMNRDINQITGELKQGQASQRAFDQFSDWLVPMAFYGMQKTQYWTADMPTWVASYEQAIRAGRTEAEAITIADRDVRAAQGSGLMSDRGMLERGTYGTRITRAELPRLLTVLGSYMFAKYNIAYERIDRVENWGSPKELASLTIDMMLLFTLETVALAVMRGQLPDEDDDESKIAYLAKQSLYTAMGTLPVVRDMTSVVQGYDGGGAYGSVLGTLGKGINAVGDAAGVTGSPFRRNDLKAMIDVGGMMLHVPTDIANKVIEGMYDHEFNRRPDAAAKTLMRVTGYKID